MNVQAGAGRAFCPNVPYSCLRVTFLSADIDGVIPADILGLKNGPSYINGQIYALTGNGTPTYDAVDQSGCLTFDFFTSGGGAGWVAAFSCVPCAQSLQTSTSPNDCMNAIPLALGCGQNSIYVNTPAEGPGVVSEGCQGCNISEIYSRWYRLHTTTAGNVQFLITPTLTGQNYDFAVYGPFPPGGGQRFRITA